ncbi:MAG TPA: endonuclease/exonuclease/phosphatase family protein [Tepidisphaeraceae bacterium]|jgi:endonuclease/exonuclease/phosphatase (EEP) superfamily protein YafD
MVMFILQLVLIALSLWFISGTLLNFSKHPHWYIRGWDFPRLFVTAICSALIAVYGWLFHERWWDWLLLAGLVFVVLRQLYFIFPYTPLAPKLVKRTTRPWGDHCFRLIISNVLMENESHDQWLKVVRGADPDVIVVVEVNDRWNKALEPLAADYPHHVRRPQENYYGMAVFSRLPFEAEPDIKFIVQPDIPSMHITFRLRDGQNVRLHALHPRPPEPIRNQDSAPRDAELVIVAKEIGKHQREVPTVVCGDLNDVAWSYTTQLFQRLSGLLDPRKGRGTYNSYNANSRIFRFPLDHVFHSDEFRLVHLQRLDHVGSDHFPIMIELSCQPDQKSPHQPETKPKPEDHEEAEEIIEKQVDRERAGEEDGHLSQGGSRGN